MPTSQKKIPGRLFILSGPSGVGKTAVTRRLLEQMPSVIRVITYTSRAPRPAEEEGKDYHFITANEFHDLLKKDFFLEWAEVHNHLYGTPSPLVREYLQQGNHVLLVIDVQGGLNVKQIMPEAVLIFLLPDDLINLEHRIRRRRQNMSDEDMVIRLANAKKEIAIAEKHYDHMVTNAEDQLEKTVEAVKNIMT